MADATTGLAGDAGSALMGGLTGNPLQLISSLLGGGANLLTQMGVLQTPQEVHNQAMLSYLQKNYPDFNYQAAPYDPSKESGILQPVEQQNQVQQEALGNKLGLQGLGRSGYGNDVLIANQNQQNQNLANLNSNLANTQQQTNYNQALNNYKLQTQKVMSMAALQ